MDTRLYPDARARARSKVCAARARHPTQEEAEGMWQRGVAYKLLPPSITDFAGVPPEVLYRKT